MTEGRSGEGYSDTVLDHFERPRNNGALDDANAIGYMTNPVCGDTLLLMLRVRDDRIEEARWQSDGCVASIAGSSLLSELLGGRSLAEANALTREAIVAALEKAGREADPVKIGETLRGDKEKRDNALDNPAFRAQYDRIRAEKAIERAEVSEKAADDAGEADLGTF